MASIMKTNVAVIICAGVCILNPGIIYADKPYESPDCMVPPRPDFQLQSEYADFKQAVNTYQRCINGFIDEQEQAVQKHLDAANKARDEWDRFVNTELK